MRLCHHARQMCSEVLGESWATVHMVQFSSVLSRESLHSDLSHLEVKRTMVWRTKQESYFQFPISSTYTYSNSYCYAYCCRYCYFMLPILY